MNIAQNIKKIREEKGLLQKQVASYIEVDKSTYSKIEKGLRDVTVIELYKMAQLFNMTVDQIIELEDGVPKAVVLEDKTEDERFKLINQLDEEDKNTVLKIIDKMLTNKKFKDFFDKNLASL
ncbi:MAG: helix-turn-helix domain-containing protein [Jhaorihella sp.]